MKRRKLVVIALLGPVLDRGGQGEKRWEKWRPTVDICRHEDLLIDRLELLCEPSHAALERTVAADIQQISPDTRVNTRPISFRNPWDFEEVFGGLHDFARRYDFRLDDEDYLVHITTGTHVAQICLFLLTESRHFPARLLQSSPPPRGERGQPGRYSVIDLDLSRYDRLASRFREERADSLDFLKSGIRTQSRMFNELIAKLERVAIRSREPILLTGPTGAGKSQLARKIYQLRQARRQLTGPFVEVNCATLRGNAAMSTLFGHVKGAYTGAARDRTGLLRMADGGMLFLDEIGELGADEQAMLLRAIEDKRFTPVGADREVESDFQLIAGTNRDLVRGDDQKPRFRDDLLARINLWSFRLPSLRERPEDIEPNLDYELAEWTRKHGTRVTFNKEARTRFLRFATEEATWPGNFRDLNAAMTRMATLAPGGRIDRATVDEEIERLQGSQRASDYDSAGDSHGVYPRLQALLGPQALSDLDRFELAQLEDVLAVCSHSTSLSAAGRALFAASRKRKKNPNDADRLRKYLARYGLDWQTVARSPGAPPDSY
ncbi:MAG: RNA repair transcriptional activator RtcR [Haliangiales bacterium]